MAKKPTLPTVSSGFNSGTTINSALVLLRDAFDNTLSLDGSTPNSMSADLDMNGQDILNANSIQASYFNIGGSALDISDLQVLTGIGADVTTLAHLEDGTVLTNGLSDLAGNVDTLVDNLSGLNSFAERYNVAASSPSSPNEGDLWYDTVNNVLKYYDGSTWQTSAGVSADEKVKISSNDTTEDFIINKLAAGSNISLTETNDGANETISIAVTGLGSLATQNTVGSGDFDADAIATADIADDQVTYAKVQNVSATSRVLGRVTAGAGVIEELTATQLKSLLGISKFTSTAITLGTGNQSYSAAHGLSANPTKCYGYLQCTTSDAGYSVGDRIFMMAHASVISFGGSSQHGLLVGSDATNVFARQHNSITVVNKTTSAIAFITASSWDLYLVAEE